MLVWQTVFAHDPNPVVIGAGLVLLGLPPAFRIDNVIRVRRNGNEDVIEEDMDPGERWSHLP
jgi:hypothetical protein